MLTLDQIRGQDRVIELLRRAIAQDRVAHAYLFCGPDGVGKMTTALALTLALECTAAPGEGCGQCNACEKVAAGIHPDVQVLERQGAAKIIPIETIRTQVIPRLGSPPHEGAARVFLVEEANALPGASANALLKTLEEPPPRTHFLLCTTAPDQLLPTIRSRCQRVTFAALGADLRAELHAGEGAAERIGELAGALHEAVQSTSFERVYQVAGEVAGERADMEAALERLAQMLHQDARQAAMGSDVARAARASRQAAIVLRTHQAVQQNAHGLLSMEALLHELRAVIV